MKHSQFLMIFIKKKKDTKQRRTIANRQFVFSRLTAVEEILYVMVYFQINNKKVFNHYNICGS